MRALRFLRVLRLHSTYMLMGLLALGALGVITLVMDPGRGMDVAVPVLLLHMFAVSSGFDVPARRGHFDLLLTGGAGRLQIAAAHWLVSAVPGVAMWLLLGVCELLMGAQRSSVFSNGSVAAVLMISILGWGLTVPLPRLSGGVIWLVVLFIALTFSGNWRAALLSVAESGGNGWSLALMFVLCPLLLVGTTLDKSDLVALLPGLIVALAVMAAAISRIATSDVRLEEAQ